MARSDRFHSMDEVAAELARLDAVRDHHEARLERHWQAMLDHDVRGRLLKDAAHDMVRSWKPTRVLNSIFGSGSVGSSFGFALGRRGGLGKRALYFALSMALPVLMKKAGDLSMSDITEEVKVSVERIKQYLRERKKAHTIEEEEA